jgi:uncharacterized membrane protein YeaQ/YmgE (transglycosylase-associated protein family)
VLGARLTYRRFVEFLHLAALGLVTGGLGGLAVPGRRAVSWSGTLAVGIVGALTGGFLASVLLGGGFRTTRLVLAAVVSVLMVCGWALYQRERRLPR